MIDPSRRRFLRNAVIGGAVAGGAVMLPRDLAQAAVDTRHGHGHGHAAAAAGDPPAYQLTVVNNSTDYVDLCVYQAPPDLGVQDVMALAWLVEPAYPTTRVAFNWMESYNFVWGQLGTLSSGARFLDSQVWPADPSDPAMQQVLFDYGNGAFTFQNGTVVATPQSGNLYIKETSNIPLGQANVGIGMSGAGTFAVAGQPNQNLVFTPHPEYWITAGTYQAGQVVSVEEITNAASLVFPPGVYALNATLNPDNTWTVSPS